MTDQEQSNTSFPAYEFLPDALAAFPPRSKGLDELFAHCDVVLDANVLLLPYTTGKESMEDIARVLGELSEKHRLFVPAQVAREYARNRPGRIGDIAQHIANVLSAVSMPPPPQIPLLEGVPEYARLKDAEKELKQATRKYQESLKTLLLTAHGWGRDDPVSVHYSEIFSKSNIIELRGTPKEIAREAESRYQRKIPPGYKDANKDDGGIGDFIIWRTILQLGGERKKDLVFVSGEEKADWMHRTNNRGIVPRIELIDEYRRASDGRSFFLVHLSRLLELGGATAATVKGLQEQEARSRAGTLEDLTCPYCESTMRLPIALAIGSSAFRPCVNCGRKFHAHRTAGGIIVRAPRSRIDRVNEIKHWFLANYKDPADGVPVDSAEGGYQYQNDGPFDAGEVLQEKYGARVPKDIIDQAMDSIALEGGPDWVRSSDY